jgi:hypothetical protein
MTVTTSNWEHNSRAIERGPLVYALKLEEDWIVVYDVAPQLVSDCTGVYKGKVIDEVKTITLVPFGCTKVRIVAFPVVK